MIPWQCEVRGAIAVGVSKTGGGSIRRTLTSTIAYLGLILFLAVAATNLFASGVVTNATEADLRAAMVGGGTVTFAVDGTIVLSNTLVITNDTVLDASGRSVILSGNNQVRVLYVNQGITLNLTNLTLANGRADSGGGMFIAGGNVNLWECNFSGNLAQGTNGLDQPFNANVSLLPGGNANGGAIYNLGNLWIGSSVLLSNRAQGGNGGSITNFNSQYFNSGGSGGLANGGAIYSSNSIRMISCLCLSSLVTGGNGGGATSSGVPDGRSGGSGGTARGGAIYFSGVAQITNSTFQSSEVKGGKGGFSYYGTGGGSGLGGAIFNAGGGLAVSNCTFVANLGTGGPEGGGKSFGADGGALGGAIHNTGDLQLMATAFVSNRVNGLSTGGGGVYHASGQMTAASTIFVFNVVTTMKPTAPYYGGSGRSGLGGAVLNDGLATLRDCTLGTNSVVGGQGTYGAASPIPEAYAGNWGCGGGLCNRGTTDVSRCTFVGNLAQGGKGTTLQPGNGGGGVYRAGAGGTGLGGGFASIAGSLIAVNCTLFGNQAWGGAGGDSFFDAPSYGGQGGAGWAGAVFTTNSLAALTNCTIATNIVSAGAGGAGPSGNPGPGSAAIGGIGQINGTMMIQNSILSGNIAGDVAGTFGGDHNIVNIDAHLGPLANNGGPTKTLALLAGSPAIDAADPASAPATDQRGVLRLFGSAPDIGAYESTPSYTNFFMRPPALMNGMINLLVVGPPNQTFRLQTSTNFALWSDMLTNATDSYGLRSLSHPAATGGGLHLYRSVSP